MWRRFLTVFLWIGIILGTLFILGMASALHLDEVHVVLYEVELLLVFSGLGLATEAVRYLEEIRDFVEDIKNRRSDVSPHYVPNANNIGATAHAPNANNVETTVWVCKNCKTTNPSTSFFCTECGKSKMDTIV